VVLELLRGATHYVKMCNYDSLIKDPENTPAYITVSARVIEGTGGNLENNSSSS